MPGAGAGHPLPSVDKGVSPNDKSHAANARFGRRKHTEFTPELRALRELARTQGPGALPIPDPDANFLDWYHGARIAEMEPPP